MKIFHIFSFRGKCKSWHMKNNIVKDMATVELNNLGSTSFSSVDYL